MTLTMKFMEGEQAVKEAYQQCLNPNDRPTSPPFRWRLPCNAFT